MQFVWWQTLNGLVLGGGYAMLAVGLTVIFGTLDIVNFAHGMFYAVGGFMAVFVVQSLGMPYLFALPLAVVVAFVLGMDTQWTIIRPLVPRGALAVLLVTLGFYIVLEQAVRFVWGPQVFSVATPYAGMAVPMGGGYALSVDRLVIVLGAVAFLGILHVFMTRSFMGTAIRSIAQNRVAAQLMGIDTDRYVTITFGVGCAIAAIAGVLMAPLTSVHYTMGLWPTMISFIVVTVGGRGSFKGAVIGGLLVGVVESWGVSFFPGGSGFRSIFPLMIMVLVLLFRPEGLFGSSR